MKILIVGSHERAVMNFRATMIKRLAKDHQVDVAIWAKDALRRAEIEALGAQVTYLNSTSGSLRPFKDLRAMAKLFWIVLRSRPQRAFVYASKPIGLAGSLLRLLRIPYVCLMEGLGTGFREGGMLWRVNHRLFAFAYGGAKTVLLLNRDNREALVRWKLCPPEKIELLDGIGVELEKFTHTPISNDIPTVLFLGRITKSKGVPLFFEAAKLVRQQNPEVRFLAAGPLVENSDGLTLDEIERYTHEDGVEYIGDLRSVVDAIRNSWCIVIPSLDQCEGMPMVLQEAFATGRPVVGTDVSGTRDGLQDGYGGLLVYPGDAGVMAASILKLTSNKAACERMGLEARQIAERRFNRETTDEKLIKKILA